MEPARRTSIVLELDRFVCGTLVIILRWLRPWRTPTKKFDHENVRQIIVSKYVGLGSIVLSQKFLYSLRTHFPGAKITFITFDRSADVMPLLKDYVNDVVVIRTGSFAAFIGSTVHAISLIRKKKADLYFDLEFFSRYSALIAFFSHPKNSVGYESLVLSSRTSMYSHPAKFIPMIHICENFINQLRTVGLELAKGPAYPEINLAPAIVDRVKSAIRQSGLTEKNFIIFNPSASEVGTYRVWPKERWVELVQKTTAEMALPIVFTGLAGDKAFVQSVLDHFRGVKDARCPILDFTGRFNLEEFFAFLSLSRMVVTVDTGTPHFAISMKKPTVIIFGPESPERYGYKLPYCRNVYKGIFCSPCLNVYHGKKIICHNENRCMTTLEASEVLGAMREMYAYG